MPAYGQLQPLSTTGIGDNNDTDIFLFACNIRARRLKQTGKPNKDNDTGNAKCPGSAI
jgi:hypothetical protein